MTQTDRDVQRKLKVLKHAEETGHVARTWCSVSRRKGSGN